MTNKIDYLPLRINGNGITTDFAFNFKALNKKDIVVNLVDAQGNITPKTIDSDYSITLSVTGGNVHFNSAPQENTVVVIERDTSLYQESSYSTSSGFQGSEVEKSFDRCSLALQEMQYKNDKFAQDLTQSVDEKIEDFQEASQKMLTLDELISEYSQSASEMNDKVDAVNNLLEQVVNTTNESLATIQTSVEHALSSHFIGEFLQSSLPYNDNHIVLADGRIIDSQNEFYSNFIEYLRELKSASNRDVSYYKIYGKGSHITFLTNIAPVDELIRLDKDNTRVLPINTLGDEYSRLTLMPTFDLRSYRRFRLISSTGSVPEYITPIKALGDDGSALSTPLGRNTTLNDADRFYSIAMGDDVIPTTVSKVNYLSFNGITYPENDVDVETVCNVNLAYKEIFIDTVEVSTLNNNDIYEVHFTDGNVGYYEYTPATPLQVVHNIELPYYNYCDVLAGYQYIGYEVYTVNDNFLTEWEYYLTTLNNDDYSKFYLSDVSPMSFYNGCTNNYTTTDTELGLLPDGSIAKITSTKEVRLCEDDSSPNNNTADTNNPLGDVYFEYITPDAFKANTYIFNSYKALCIYINKADGSVSITGGGYYSNSAWHWRISKDTGIKLLPNTRYSFDFKVNKNSTGSPSSWSLIVKNMNNNQTQQWQQNTSYYPYNYRHNYGITTIACNANVTMYSGGILDLSTMIIKGQNSILRPIESNAYIGFIPDTNIVVLPRLSEQNGIKTYIVLNGVKTVNSTYDVDLTPYALKENVYTKTEIDNKGFALESDIPDVTGFVTSTTVNELANNISQNYALKSEIPLDLEDLSNNVGYATTDEVRNIITDILNQNVASYDDTGIRLDIEQIQADLELLKSNNSNDFDNYYTKEEVEDLLEDIATQGLSVMNE